jgi:hypothetical protein
LGYQYQFLEIPPATTTPVKKTTVLDGKTSLANISPQIAGEPTGLTKACALMVASLILE